MMDTERARLWMSYYNEGINERADELNRLDAALGDGDFGASMQRGTLAVAAALDTSDATVPGDLFKLVGMTLVSAMGGTSGPLVGTLFIRMGMTLGDVESADVATLAAALRAGADGVMALGDAAPGDKTMLDGLVPAVEAMETSGGEALATAAGRAAVAATGGAEATRELVARRGRASYVANGGQGHVDPGSVGMAILFASLEQAANSPS